MSRLVYERCNGSYKVGGDVISSKAGLCSGPEYNDEARKRRLSGTTMVSIVVDVRGKPQEVKVTRSLAQAVDQSTAPPPRIWTTGLSGNTAFAPAKAKTNRWPFANQMDVTFQLF